MSQRTIICVTDEEPACFHPPGQRGFAVRLSVRSEAPDEDLARTDVESFLKALAEIRFGAYALDGTKLVQIALPLEPVARASDPGKVGDRFRQWLRKRAKEQAALPGASGRFYQAAPAPVTGAPVSLTETSLDAEYVVRAAASWTAPVAQQLQLAFILRIDATKEAPPLAFVPYFDAAPPELRYEITVTEPGETVVLDGYAPGAAGLNLQTTLSKRPVLDSTEIDPVSGFLKVTQGTEAGHRALIRIEERAGSLLTGYFAVREMCSQVRWPAPGPDGAYAEAELQAARLLGWAAVAAMASALDTVLIAARMPGRQTRDGALIAPFLDLLEMSMAQLDRAVFVDQPPSRTRLREAVRQGIGAALPPAPTDAPGRRVLVASLNSLCRTVHESAWHKLLLDAYIEQDDSWKQVAKAARTLVADYRGAAPLRAPAEALDLALAPLQDTVTSEKGVEDTVLTLLGLPAVREAWIAALADLMHAPVLELGPLYDKAVKDLGQRFGAELNGAEAARHAIGSLVADLLPLASTDKRERATADQLASAFSAWRFWERRLALEPDSTNTNIETVLAALVHPVADLAAFVGGESDAFQIAAQMHASAAEELFSSPGARFLPDHAPQDLAVRLSIDPAADDDDNLIDDFAAVMAGVALVVRTNAGPASPGTWAYANLAQLTAGDAAPLEPFGIQAIPTTVVDGRRNMFVAYNGLPIATSAFDNTLTGPAAQPWQRFLSSDYPAHHPGYAGLKPLAYGTTVEIAAHVVGRAGSLPFPLQERGGAPWQPEATIGFDERDADGNEFVTRLPYSRRTAVGRTSIVLSAGIGAGNIPAGVTPLAMDYPRLGLSNSFMQFLDVHRNGDGSGALAVPEALGASTQVVLRAVRYAGQAANATLTLGLLNEPALADTGAATASLTLGPGPGVDLVLTLTCTREASGGDKLQVQVEIEAGTARHQSMLTLERADPLWLRLQLGATGPAALSLADPSADAAPQAAQARAIPDNLVLLGSPLPGRADLWRAPFNRASVQAHIEWPRVGYLDFQRWCANPALRAAFYHDLDVKLIEKFEVLLLAAYIGRTDDVELAEMLERLPDPAVSSMRIDLFETDSLCTDPQDRSAPATLLPLTRQVPVPRMSVLFSAKVRAAIAANQVKVVLRAIDQGFRHALEVAAAGQDAAKALAIDNANRVITIPAGAVVRLVARPQVARALFAVQASAPAVMDERLLQWAVGFDSDQQYASFEGASLQFETMIGPLVSSKDSGWRLSRAGWIEQVQGERIEHEAAGVARQYRLRAVPVGDGWHWRQLASMDVATQRWRFSGRPIYTWFSPKQLARYPAKAARAASIELDPTRVYRAFEEEAFHGRDPRDAELETVPLLPLPAVTTLSTVAWEQASATLFRHRFVLRSRYAGAMQGEADGQCEAWATGLPDNDEFAWRRIAMLADRSHLTLTRPQVRALLPLTCSPEEGAGATPPTICVLQEQPFCNGGLAARVCAEIKTGLGYELKTVTLPLDARKEIGPDPRLSYLPFPAAQARRVALPAEGPIGLTFDRDIGQGAAFANTALMLTPQIPGKDGPQALALDEHFLSVVLQRYLDLAWLVDESGQGVRRSAGAGKDERLGAPFATTWWIQFGAGAGDLVLNGATGERGIVVARWSQAHGELQLMMNRRALDPSVELPAPPAGDGPVADPEALALCAIASDALGNGSVAFLHTPLDERRANLSAFFVPGPVANDRPFLRSGAGNAPVLLGSIEWMASDGWDAAELLVGGAGASVHAVNASASTALHWTRTNRNFDTVLCQAAKATDKPAPTGVGKLAASRNKAQVLIHASDSATEAGLWIRTSQGAQPFPVHAQRHLAVLPSYFQSAIGRPIEIPTAARMAPGRAIVLPGTADVDQLRVIEFEVPAIILGLARPGEQMPAPHKQGYLDLRSSGFDRLEAATRAGVDLSLFLRVVASPEALRMLVEVELELRTEAGGDPVYLALQRSAGIAAFAFSADLAIGPNGAVTEYDSYTIDAAGAVTRPGKQALRRGSGALPAWQLLPAPGSEDVQSSQGMAMRVASAKFSDGIGRELWLEIGMLASAAEPQPRGFMHEVDFDWFFGNSTANVDDAISLEGLRGMREAQGRIIAVSQPIRVQGAP